MSEIRVLPAPEDGQRVETGPVRFGDDWAGFFVRGDGTFDLPMAAEVLERVWEEYRAACAESGKRFDFNEHIVVINALGLLKRTGECHE